ncbi:DUF5776 domain-containing protein [Apilactobacillus kunkeei]|uniref:DUF5776 domain-containing protein n=1 Tax=Apilactobacillus kunkeei TaxID=148814 RepID=A0A0M9DGG5_9LACO|nr:DUF5776 domain-containing protein [Apilactobacillus kunkeei]KOY79686.1 hypothetical protein RZ72_07440 [Apilactobacillus kunkeei]
MQYNKNEFNKVNDKKVMKKVKKQWVVVSITTLALLGASAYGMTSTSSVVAHAADGTSQQQEGSQNSGASDDTAALKSSAANQGSLDGTAEATKSTVSSAVQGDYDTAYSAASTAASTAASSAGSSDFAANKSKATYANHQDAYNSGYDAASSTAQSQKSAATQRGHDDFAAGNSQATLSSNNDLYSAAYTAASSASAKGHNDFAAGSSHATNLGTDQDVYDTAFNAASNAALQGRNDFVAGSSKASNYGTDQDVYNSAFETASNAASQGVHDFNTTGSKAASVADQDIYNSAFNSAYQTSVNNSVAASANATSAGIDDYVEGHTVNSSVGSVNQSTYNTAYSMASSGFNDTLNGSSAAGSNANDSNYQKGVSYASGSYAAAMSAAISDAVYGTNTQQSYATDAVQSAFYSAAYAGAESALAQYNNKVGTQGTGSQAYVYYKNTANSVYSTSYAPGSASGANVTNGYVNASNVSYNASYAATYTGQYSDAPQGTVGGADDPKTAHDTAISYENDISNLYDNTTNTGLNGSTSGVTVASQKDIQDNSSLLGALSVVYRYGINNALIQQGIKDAETGKWQGITGANGQTGSIYTPSSNSDNLYDQAYLGAQAAINTQFNGDNYTGVTQLSNPSTFTSAYKVGYNDVYSKDQQGVYYVNTGTQLNTLLTGGSTSSGGTVNSRIDMNHKNIINIINDISLVSNSSSNGGNNTEYNNFENLTIDGNNHIADWSNQNYNFNTGDGNQSVHLQNFKTIYGANYFGPVGFTSNGNVYFKNFNYIGAQLLSAINNQVFMDGNVNVSQRDDFYTSPWKTNTIEAGPGNQLNLYIKNLVLNKGAHYFGTSGAHSGTTVVYVSGGNVTLSENSGMTVINRGTGGDSGNGYGVEINGGSLNVNKNANLNIMQDNTTAGASDGGIYVYGNSSNSNAVTIDGGRINVETANYSNTGYNQLVYVYQGKVLVTNGGVLQTKATNIGNNVPGNGLIYIGSAGQINVANRGNLIVSTPDGSGNSAFPLIYGNLTVNDSGDSHVILDKGSTSSKAVFVNSSGSINSYTGKVNGTIYYNYSMTSSGYSGSETVNALNKDMQSISNKNYSALTSTPQVLEIQSIPSVYFSSPLTTTINSDSTVTVTGYAKVSGYQSAINSGGTDAAYAKNKVYIQYATGNTTGTIYDSLGNASTGPDDYHNLTPISTSVSSANKNDSSIPTTGTISNVDQADTNAYNDDADPSSSIIPIKFTVPLSNVKTVGVYLRYGVNGVYMTALPSNNPSGGSTYASNIEGYQLNNGKLVTASAANVSIASGNGQNTENGYQQALSDFRNGQNNPDPTQYGRNADYTNAYDSVMAGAGALTPDFLTQLGVTDPTAAPSFDSIKNNPALLSKIQALPSYQSAKNPTAYLQAMGQAYQDYLANQDAVNAINKAGGDNPSSINSGKKDALYKSNFSNAYQNAQNAINDAIAGNTSNRPKNTDPIGQQVYDKVQQQYNSGMTAMDAVANGVPSAPANTDPTAFAAAQTAYGQIVKDIRNGKNAPVTDFSQAPYNAMTPLQQALYKQGFANALAKYQAGQQAALNGKGNPTDPQQLAGYNDTKDGFNGNPTSSDPTTEQNSPAYTSGQQAKSQAQAGEQAAKNDASAQPGSNDSQAKKDGLQATKDAYAVATGKKKDLTPDQFGQQSLAYQAAYTDAKATAEQVVKNALSDYKNGHNNAPQGTGVDNQAYTQVQNAAATGASDANQPNSPAAPDSSQSDAYKEGYNIAKGSADALNGAQKNSNNSYPEYKDAYDQATDGFKGANNTAPENQTAAYQAGQKAKTDSQTGANLATTGQSLPANPSQAEKDGYQAAKDAYDVATGKKAPISDADLTKMPLAYQDAYRNALAAATPVVNNALADYKNGSTTNQPTDSNSADGKLYQAVKDDAAAGATAASQPNSSATPDANQTTAYKAGYDIAKGSADALNGAQKNSNNNDDAYKDAYDQAADGFKGANNTAPENQTASYKAGQQAKTDSQKGADLATKGQSLPTNPTPSQAETDGFNATKDALDAATGKQPKLTDDQLKQKPLAYQDAYNKALALAEPAATKALADYKSGSQANQPQGNGLDRQAYDKVQSDAAAGATDAIKPNSSATPDSSKSAAYQLGYNIAKGTADAEAGQTSQQPNNSDYQTAFNHFNAAKAQGENAKLTDKAPADADQATKDGFAYGQGIAALKNANNPEDPSTSQVLTGKQLDGFNAAKSGYEAAMKGENAPAAAVEGYNYAKALTDGAAASTRPTQATGSDDLPTEQKAYDDTQAAIAQAKADVKAGKTGSQLTPSDGNANNKDVYDKAYAAAVKAYQNTDPTATAASAGISQDAVGTAAFNAAKSDGLKVQGAKAFTDGKANTQSDSNYTKGYDDAKQGYVAALKGNATDSASSTDAYNTGAAAGANDKAGFQSAENGNSDNSDAAKGAAAAIAAVKAAKGKDLDSLPESNDSINPASYNNAYNAALEDAKQAAKQGIASQLTPDSKNTQTPGPAALADVYKAAANDAQKGYAEGLTGKSVSDGNNASETQGNQKGAADKQKYDDALADFAKGIKDPANASTDQSVKSDPVYRSALAALVDASNGTTGSDNSPVYTVANSQALGSKDAQAEIAKDAANGTDPQSINDLSDSRLAHTPAKDKQSYMNAYNDAIKGYDAGKSNTSDQPDNNDTADKNAFTAGKAAGQAARGANEALNGEKTNDDVASDLNGTDPDKKAYAQGVTDANNGYAKGLNDATPMSSDDLAKQTPAYQKAYAQGQADKAGVDAAKSQATPDVNNVPQGIANNKPAADAYKGYAAAVAAVKDANGNTTKADRPSDFDSQSSDFKAAYQKALQDAVDANKAGQDSVANPSLAAARPRDSAQAAVYDAARADASKGYAEGLTGKVVSDTNNGNEKAGLQAGQNDKAKYEAAVKDYAAANGDVTAAKADHPDKANDSVYQETLRALDDGAKGNTDSTDKSPVYAVANSQALAKKAAMDAIKAANTSANGNNPQQITDANVPAGVPDKQSYMNAYNDAIKGYNAGKANDSSATPDNSDPADQQAFNDAKAAGQAARGANDLLNGVTTAKNVDGTTNDPSYIAGVDDSSAGYTDGLNGTKTASEDVQATPAYQKAYAQGQADQAGVSAAKGTQNPDTNTAPNTLPSNAAKDAYLGYANAIAAVKNAHGNPSAIQTPANYSQKSSDYKAAYQKALEDAIAANKAGQNAVATPGKNDTKPTDHALAAVYDAAKHDTNKGMAEALSGKPGNSDPSNANEQAGIQAGTALQAAYQAAAKDFAAGITDPTNATQTFSDPAQAQAYRDALAGMKDGSQTPASDTNDPKSDSPIYAIAKQQSQNVQNAVAAAQGSQNVASGQPNKAADLANANGYNNPDNKPDMDDAYAAAANAYSDAINHNNNDQPVDQSGHTPAAKLAYAQAYNAAKDAAAKGLTDFGNGNKAQQPSNLADEAAYNKAQSDALAGLNDGLANHADATKQQINPAYKQGVDDAAAIQKAAEDAVNGTSTGKANLTPNQQAAYDHIKSAADAGQTEYTDHPDLYAGKTGDDLKNAANQAAQAQHQNDPLKQAAFVQAIEAAGDAFGKGAEAFGNGEAQPAGITNAGYQAAQQAYNAATDGTGKPEKVNGHYLTPQGVTPSDQYDKTFDAAYDKYKAAVDIAAQDTANNGGTAATAANSDAYKDATPKEQAAYNYAATKAAQGIADAKLDDPTKDAQYGTTKDGKFVPNDDTAAQAYAGAKAGYADGKTGATNEPTNVSPAYKSAYDKANADAKAAAHAGVEDFAKGYDKSYPQDNDSAAVKDARSNGYNQAAAGYQAAMSNPSGDFSSNPDASYQKGVEMAKAAAAARDNVLNNGDNAQPTAGETSTDSDVQGAAKAAAAAAKAALADGKDGKNLVNGPADVPAAFKPYAQIYAGAYATVQNAAVQSAQDGAKAFASDGKEGNHVTDPNNKSVDAVANQEGYKDAHDGYQDAQTNPDAVASNPNTGSVNGDEAAKGAAAAFNDVAGKDNAKPGDHATSDNNPVYEAAYQKALAEGKENASDGAEALFNNNTNSTVNAATIAKPNATTAADKAFNKGLENAKDALNDAQTDDPSKDAQYNGDNANTDAGNVYHATQDAYNAVLNGEQPLTASQLAAKDPVYAAAYKNALLRAQTASTNGATDTNDNGASYAPNALAQAVYEKARSGANKAYQDALANKDPELKDHNGIDKSSVAYQATQNAINDYLKNNGNAMEDPTAAGMDPANAQAYKAYYEKAKAAVDQAATDGVNAYLGGKAINDVPSVEGDNAGLGQVAKEAAERAEKGHEDAINNGGRVSDANQPIAKDLAYLTGLKGAQDAAKGVGEAMADSTKQPDANAPQSEKDGFNGTVDGYNKAATDGSIKPEDIDAYIADNLGNKSIAYRDAFKNAYLDGLKVAKAGADAANANQPDATNGQNGANQKAESQGYKDATNAFLDKLHGVDDKDATSNAPAAVSGRQRASQYVLALQNIAEGHPNTGSTDPDYQKGLATAEAAVAQAVADAKANKQLPSDLSQISVPEGSDPVAYRDAYAGILSGFYNGYNSKPTDSGSTDAYYNIAFGIGYAKGKASIPTDTSAPLDFWKNTKAPKITDPAVAKAYKEQYAQAKAGFYDALYKRGSKSNNEYYKESYKTAMDGLAGMRLAAKGDTKANRKILKTKDAAFLSGYNGYLKGIEAAKRTLKKNKKLSAKDLLNKDKLYTYTFKQGLKHEIKIQRSHGKKAGVNRALERRAIPKDIYTHHSATYARTFVATYKKEMKRHMPRYIYNVGTIFTHNRVKFTNHTRIREYAYSTRYNSTVFRVVGVKYYKNRIPRYRLSNGAVVTASQAVQNAYYKKQFKKYTVIKPTGVLIHTGKTFSKRNSVRRLYRGEVFHVRKVVKFHGITRLYVGKNEYITSNKTFVKAVIK